MQAYSDNVALIMEGKTPLADRPTDRDDTPASEKALVPPSAADSLLRAQLEGDGRFALVNATVTPSGAVVRRMEFIAPVKGEVISRFDPGRNMFGTGIVPDGAQQVVAAQARHGGDEPVDTRRRQHDTDTARRQLPVVLQA